jgi:cholesterol oxidase
MAKVRSPSVSGRSHARHRQLLSREHLVVTNSESILAVTAPGDARDLTRAAAITSSIYPDPDTHIEPGHPPTLRPGRGFRSLLFLLMTEAGTRRNQPLQLVLNILRAPPAAGAGGDLGQRVVAAHGDPDRAGSREPQPHKIAAAHRAAEWMQEKLGGTAQAVFNEAIFSAPMTAHILGGAVIGADPQTGVVDERRREFGLRTCWCATAPPSLPTSARTPRSRSLRWPSAP